MKEVNIRTKNKNISIPGNSGTQFNQLRQHLELYFPESGEVVPDNFYTLSQGEIEEACSVIGGEARGVEWVDRSKKMFIV